MMHIVGRGTDLFAAAVERRPGALVAAAATVIGTVLSVTDGLSSATAAATAVATATVALVTLTVRVLLSDVRGLRNRIQTLEAREDARIAAIEAERTTMMQRIAELERRLTTAEGV